MPSRYSLFSQALGGGALLGLLFLPAYPAKAIDPGGLGGKPARPQADNARSQSIFIHTIEPGASVADAILVINNEATEKRALVYATDSQISSGGAFACAQKVDSKNSVGSWITVEQEEVAVPAFKTAEVGFSITVPGGTAPGEYNGCLVVQEADRAAEVIGNGLSLSFRSAVRVAITVPGELRKGLFITHLTSEHVPSEQRAVQVKLKNNGNVSLDTDVRVSLTFLGLTKGVSVGGTFPILANNESTLNFLLNEPKWGGFYVVAARATYNPDPSAGIGSMSASTTEQVSQLVWVKPAPRELAIELLLLAATVLGIAAFIWRRVQLGKLRRGGRKHTVAKNEDIQSIAQKYQVSWKLLARINHLKPPYTIQIGQELTVPSKKKQSRKA